MYVYVRDKVEKSRVTTAGKQRHLQSRTQYTKKNLFSGRTPPLYICVCVGKSPKTHPPTFYSVSLPLGRNGILKQTYQMEHSIDSPESVYKNKFRSILDASVVRLSKRSTGEHGRKGYILNFGFYGTLLPCPRV